MDRLKGFLGTALAVTVGGLLVFFTLAACFHFVSANQPILAGVVASVGFGVFIGYVSVVP